MKLNKYSCRVTQDDSQPAAKAMLHAIGLSKDDLKKPFVGIASTGYEGNPCNMHLNNLAKKVKEGTRERVQAYEGVCIARGGHGIHASFTVRKISYGEGVERVFPLYSPRLESIELIRRGSVRRAKLYYMRDRRGKSARIAERKTGHGIEKKEAKK